MLARSHSVSPLRDTKSVHRRIHFGINAQVHGRVRAAHARSRAICKRRAALAKAADAVFVMLMHSLLTSRCRSPICNEARYISDPLVPYAFLYLLRHANAQAFPRFFCTLSRDALGCSPRCISEYLYHLINMLRYIFTPSAKVGLQFYLQSTYLYS